MTGPLTLTAHWTKQVYTVSFDANGGSAVADQSVAFQDSASRPAPTRTGYDFAGWFSGGTAYDFTTPVTGALTLTAHWAKQVYTVTFDSNGGSAVADQSVAFEELASEPTAPTRTGYDFSGWFSGGDAYDFSTPVTGGADAERALGQAGLHGQLRLQRWFGGGRPVGGLPGPGQRADGSDPGRLRLHRLVLGRYAYDFTTPVTGPWR